MKLGQLAHRGVFLLATRQMNLKAFVPIHIPQLRHVLEATSTALQPIYLPSISVIRLHKSSAAKKSNVEKRTRQVYSKEDDKFIREQVELHGYTSENFKKIAKALGRKYPYAVKIHYDEYIIKQYDVTGSFSPEEDKKIIEHVNIHGEDKESFEDIAKILGRRIKSVRERCLRLLSENEYETNSDIKEWDFAEDEILINYIFKLKEIDSINIFTLWEVNRSELALGQKAYLKDGPRCLCQGELLPSSLRHPVTQRFQILKEVAVRMLVPWLKKENAIINKKYPHFPPINGEFQTQSSKVLAH